MTTSEMLTASLILSFVVMMHLICSAVAGYLGRPRLVIISTAIVTGSAAGVSAFPFMPTQDALAVSVFVAVAVAVASHHLSSKSLFPGDVKSKRGKR